MKKIKYWIRLLKLFYHYQKKSTRLPYMPIRAWIELTSFCNYRCIMCPNKDLKKEDKGYMDFDLFKKILTEMQDQVFEINLAHRGESLLHPHIVEAIELAKSMHFYTRLHTNGSLLTEDLSRKIISAGLDRLSFSFDGCEKKTYEKIRVGGNFEKTVNNIVRFLEIKQETNSKKPETAIEVIYFGQENRKIFMQNIDKFKANFHDLPLDSIVTKELHNWAGEIQKKDLDKPTSICPFPWNAMVINWDGKVMPCTQDFFGYYVVGDARDSSIRSIWNSDKMIYLRKKLAEKDIDEFETCSKCDRVRRKGLLGIPKEYLWKFISKRMP
jgi:radical SAM protein with 4Fe4S-binding SPASM domain